MNLLAVIPLVVSLLAAAPQPAVAAAEPAPSTIPGVQPLPGLPNVLVSGVPAVPAPFEARVRQYLQSRQAALQDVSADGRQVLVTTRFAETAQLHRVAMPLGARQQLTFDREPIASARFLPGSADTLFFLQDVGGGEFFQVYRYDLRTSRAELLTDGKSRHQSLVLSEDGRKLAYSGTGRNGKDADVYVASAAEPHQARRLTELAGTWSPIEFSRDGTQLLVAQFRAADDSDLHVVDLATGERRQLTPREGKGSVSGATFTRDGKGVYLVTDRYSDFDTLYRLDLRRAPYASAPPALTGSLKWNVEGVELSPDGRTLAVSVNEDGYGRLYTLPAGGGALRKVSLPDGVLGGLRFPQRRSDLLFYTLLGPSSPSDVYSLDLGTGRSTRWTQSEVGGLDTARFVAPELVRYPSKDGVTVPAFLVRAPRPAGARSPVVVLFHGGPEGQSRPTFSPLVQFLARELGVSVLIPNVRGSDGYGKAYRAMDDGAKREQSLADIGATLDFVARDPGLDPARVGVYGGSYGGYMVLASAAFYPTRLRAAVDVVGISSLPTFLQNTQAYRRDLRRAEYGDERDPAVRAVQERISPLNAVDRIQAALFVLQGKNDPRVPQSEAEQIVKAVRAKGRDAWYFLALDEGHGFQKKPNSDAATTLTLYFFQQQLAPAAGAPAAR